jgi:tight adherence protein B
VALPLMLFGFLFVTRRSYISLLWTTPAGVAMSLVALILLGVGWLWMRAMARVEI